MHRLLSRLAPAALAGGLAVGAVTGCSAGQIAQTANQVSTVDGSTATIGNISLRDITFEYPPNGTYEPGDDARLEFTAVNSATLDADSLVSVSSTAFDGAPVDSGSDLPVQLPAGTDVSFGGDGELLELTDLTEQLLPSVRVPVTFTFQVAGEVTVMVPVAVPLDYVEKDVEPFDFHVEE